MKSKCSECGIKKSRFVKELEAKRFIKQFRSQNTVEKNSIVKCFSLRGIKINEILNKSLLAGDKLILEMQLKQPCFTCSACGLFTKNKEKIGKLMQTGSTNFI